MSYLFLRKDFDALAAKIDELSESMRAAGDEKGLMASQTSETWHDNFGFEEEERAQNMLARRLEDFVALQNEAELIDAHPVDEAAPGARITIQDDAARPEPS